MKRRILMLALFFSVCACAFFSLNSVSFFPAERFAAAQSQWQSNMLSDYEAVIQVALPLSEFVQYRSVIRDGQIVELGRRGGLALPGVEQTYPADSFQTVTPEEAPLYTVEGLMSFANDTIGRISLLEIRSCRANPPYYDIDYNPQYGYIDSMRITCGGGFLGCTISDCGGGYTVLNFTPISP
jgi:hypothetical protein